MSTKKRNIDPITSVGEYISNPLGGTGAGIAARSASDSYHKEYPEREETAYKPIKAKVVVPQSLKGVINTRAVERSYTDFIDSFNAYTSNYKTNYDSDEDIKVASVGSAFMAGKLRDKGQKLMDYAKKYPDLFTAPKDGTYNSGSDYIQSLVANALDTVDRMDKSYAKMPEYIRAKKAAKQDAETKQQNASYASADTGALRGELEQLYTEKQKHPEQASEYEERISEKANFLKNAVAYKNAVSAREAQKTEQERMKNFDMSAGTAQRNDEKSDYEEATKRQRVIDHLKENYASDKLISEEERKLKKYLHGYDSFDDFKSAWLSREKDMFTYERNKVLSDAEQLKSAEDYGAVVAEAKAEAKQKNAERGIFALNSGTTAEQLTYYRDLRNSDRFADDAERRTSFLHDSADGSTERLGMYMTAPEYNRYMYMSKTDPDKAEKYLEALNEQIETRYAVDIADALDGKTARELTTLFSFAAQQNVEDLKTGLTHMVGGAFNDDSYDYIPPSYRTIAHEFIDQDLGEGNEAMFGKTWGQIFGDLAWNTGNMLPSVLASSVANVVLPGSGEIIGSAMMGFSAASQSYQEAVNAGYDKDSAREYGIAIGLTETVFERVLGGITPFSGGSGMSGIAEMLAKNVDHAWQAFFLKWGVSASGEFFEEYLEEWLEPQLKKAILNDDSEVIPFFSSEALYAGLLGFASGLIFDLPGTAQDVHSMSKLGQSVKSSASTSDVVALTNDLSGNAVDSNISAVDSNSAATESTTDGKAKKKKEPTAYRLGVDLLEAGETIGTKNRTQALEQLTERGYSADKANSYIELASDYLSGDTSTVGRIADALVNDSDSTAALDVLFNPRGEIYRRSFGYSTIGNRLNTGNIDIGDAITMSQRHEAESGIKRSTETAARYKQAETDGNAYGMPNTVREQLKLGKAEKYRYSKENSGGELRTVRTDSGETAKIKDAIINNGKAELVLDNGSTVPASSVTFASKDDAILLHALTASKMDGASAAGVFMDYSGNGVISYAAGMLGGYENGMRGNTHAESYYIDSWGMNPRQYNFAYRLGETAAAHSNQQRIKEAKKTAKTDPNRRSVKGKLELSRSAEKATEKMTKTERAHFDEQRTVGELMAELYPGLKVVLHASEAVEENGQTVHRDIDTHEVLENGWYDSSDGSIHLDINSGINGDGIMAFAMSHELVHYIRDISPDMFRKLTECLSEIYYMEGMSLEELARARAERDDISYDTAFEESVAHSLERMLLDSDALEYLIKMKKRESGLFNRLRGHVDESYEHIKQLRAEYEGRKPESVEGRVLGHGTETILQAYEYAKDEQEKAYKAYAEAKDSASRKERIVELSEARKVLHVAEARLEQARTYTASMTKMYKRLHKLFAKAAYMASENGEIIRSSDKAWSEMTGSSQNIHYDTREYDKPITINDVKNLRSIGRKNINDFTSEDIQKSKKWAHKFYMEIGTKSPFFRAWFGDWRKYDKSRVKIVDKKGYTHASQINHDTGWEIIVSKKIGKETTHHSGNNERNAVKYLDYIDDITENAILLDTQTSDKSNQNSLMYHTMYAYTEILGYPALLKLKVEELYYEGHGISGTIKRDYILQNIEEETVSSRNRISSPNHEEAAPSTISISNLYELVKAFDKDFSVGSEVNPALLNADGTPKVLHHQTDEDITVFDIGREGAGTSDNQTPFGVFLKSTDADIGLRGKKQMPLYARITNPLSVYNRDELTRRLKEMSPTYSALWKESKAIDREYSEKAKQAQKEFTDYIIRNSQSENRKTREEMYNDPEFNRAYDAEEKVVDEWTAKSRENDILMKREIEKTLRENNYDGVIMSRDVGSFGRVTDAFIVLDNTQVKSATDNIGTFDRNNPNIRYQQRAKSEETLRAETAETILRDKYNVNVGKLLEGMDSMLENYKGSKSRKELEADILEAAVKTNEFSSGEGSFKHMSDAIESLTDEIIASSPVLTTEIADDNAVEAQRAIKEMHFKVSDKIKADFESAKDYESFRKQHIGRLPIISSGVDVDVAYAELNSRFGESLFPSDIVNPADQLRQIAEITDLKQRTATEIEIGEIRNAMMSSLYRSFSDPVQSEKLSARERLVTAMESQLNTRTEYNILRRYRSRLNETAKYEQHIHELESEIAAARKEGKKTSELRDKYTELQKEKNRLAVVDSQLLRTELSEPLRNAAEIARERQLKRTKARMKAKEQEKIKNIKEDMKQQLKEQRAEAREKQLATIRRKNEQIDDIKKQYAQREREKRESRNETELRHHIKRTSNELKKLLLNGSKEHHIPHELTSTVAKLLHSFDVLNASRDSRIPKVQARIEEAQARLDAARAALDSASDAETAVKLREDIERYEAEIAHDRNIIDKYVEQTGRAADLAEFLGTVYKAYENDEDSFYNPEIAKLFGELKTELKDKPLRDMTLDELERLDNLFSAVKKLVSERNKVFFDGKKQTISNIAEQAISQIEENFDERSKKYWLAGESISEADWMNLKPIYGARRTRSAVITELMDSLIKGEGDYARLISEAVDYRSEQCERFGYDKKWQTEKIDRTFTSSTGKSFKLTYEEAMMIYVAAKRAGFIDHLTHGGFRFEGKRGIVKGEHDVTYYKLNAALLNEISESLTENQRSFADAMQRYLAENCAEQGNAVALERYGWKIFTEKAYVPIQVVGDTVNKNEVKVGDSKLINSGITKSLKKGAKNPVVLRSFSDVWAEHVNKMALFSTIAVPLETFERVLNYNSRYDTDTDTRSLRHTLEQRCGRGALKFFDQLITDLNGGVHTGIDPTLTGKFFSRFKKGAVLGSVSVGIQQPSAIGRAFAYVDIKYFADAKHLIPKIRKEIWEEVKKYAPVAIIKEMGYFDTGIGRSVEDYINSNDYDGFGSKLKAFFTDGDYRDEKLGTFPQVMDELTWCHIWDAVKNKVRAEQNLSGEQLLQEAGRQFTEVITKTQVYDSVLSRNAFMRSNSLFAKMTTAFMAEPTTTINMLEDAATQFRHGGAAGKRFFGRVVASCITTTILNSILKSFVTAARDDDDDQSYLEKYIEAFVGSMADDLIPFNYVPILRDIWSMVQGYDIERGDMTLFADLITATKNILSAEEISYRNIEDFAGAIANFCGLPVKNVMRDIRSAYQAAETVLSDNKTTAYGIRQAFKENIPFIDSSPRKELYNAIKKGDSAAADEIMADITRGKDLKPSTVIRQVLREYDDRVRDAAMLRYNGDIDGYAELVKAVRDDGFDLSDVIGAVNSELNKIEKENAGETDETSGTSDSTSSEITQMYNKSDIIRAYGDTETTVRIANEMQQAYIDGGRTKAEAKLQTRTRISTAYYDIYRKEYLAGNKEEARMKIYATLRETHLYPAGGIADLLAGWNKRIMKEQRESK